MCELSFSNSHPDKQPNNRPDMDIQQHVIKDFTFTDGTVLPSVSVAYTVLNPSATKTALVISCFRGRLENTYTFASGALKDYRIVTVALFGNGESSSPSNTPGFPCSTLEYQDCVKAQHDLLVNGLGVNELDVVVGFSMGGQTTYHWTLMYPAMVRNAVIICSSARTSNHNIQFLEGPRAALENAVDYVPVAKRDKDTPRATRGIQAFGKAYSAWLTSAEWFDEEKFRDLGFETRAAWDATTTGPNYNGWDADDLLAMLGMWQRGDITRVGNLGSPAKSLAEALGNIRANVLLIPCQTDQYFRPYVSKQEAEKIPNVTCNVIPSIWGHLAGGAANPVDTKWMDDEIDFFLN